MSFLEGRMSDLERKVCGLLDHFRVFSGHLSHSGSEEGNFFYVHFCDIFPKPACTLLGEPTCTRD